MKLWGKKYKLNKKIEKYTVGDDYILDLKLVKYDCIASIAHAKMLQKIKMLSSNIFFQRATIKSRPSLILILQVQLVDAK